MGIQIQWWDGGQTTLHIQFQDDWLWEHVMDHADDVYQILQDSPAPLVVVVNLLNNTQCPPMGFAKHVINLNPVHHHPHLKHVVFMLPRRSSIQPLIESVIQMHGSPHCAYDFCHSLSDVEHLLGVCFGC